MSRVGGRERSGGQLAGAGRPRLACCLTRRVTYLGQNAAATTARLAPEDLAELDALGGQVVGDRYADMSGVGR